MCMFIVLISLRVQQTAQFTPLVLELSLIYGLISSGENSAHFLQLMPFHNLTFKISDCLKGSVYDVSYVQYHHLSC